MASADRVAASVHRADSRRLYAHGVKITEEPAEVFSASPNLRLIQDYL